MADQHNANIPALANTIAADIPDIKENLEFHKDVFENFVGTWSNTVATGIYPVKFSDVSASPVVWQRKIVEIGDWNMQSTESVNVAHGLTLSKIRGASALIRNDADTAYYPLPAFVATFIATDAVISGINGTNVILTRSGTGGFVNSNYDATSYNRGWVIIDCIP